MTVLKTKKTPRSEERTLDAGLKIKIKSKENESSVNVNQTDDSSITPIVATIAQRKELNDTEIELLKEWNFQRLQRAVRLDSDSADTFINRLNKSFCRRYPATSLGIPKPFTFLSNVK